MYVGQGWDKGSVEAICVCMRGSVCVCVCVCVRGHVPGGRIETGCVPGAPSFHGNTGSEWTRVQTHTRSSLMNTHTRSLKHTHRSLRP